MAKVGEAEVLAIPPMDLRMAIVHIEGDSRLVTHQWSEKAKQMIRDKQGGKARVKNPPKDPQQEYENAAYRTADGGYGVPSIAFKSAVVSAATQAGGVTKVFLRGAFHIPGDLVAIKGTPRMREDMVRVGMGTADLRYRPEFVVWGADVPVRYNANVITLEQLAHLFHLAGFAVGVGEHRPEKDGDWGMFHVTGVTEVRNG